MEEGRATDRSEQWTEGASKFTVAWAGPCAGLGVTLGFRSVSLALMAATRPGTTLFSLHLVPRGIPLPLLLLSPPLPSAPLILLPPSFLRFASFFVLLPFSGPFSRLFSSLLSSSAPLPPPPALPPPRPSFSVALLFIYSFGPAAALCPSARRLVGCSLGWTLNVPCLEYLRSCRVY